MSRRIITSDEILSAPEGAEMVITPGAIITDRAREAATERSIQFRFDEVNKKTGANGSWGDAAGESPSSHAGRLNKSMRAMVALASDHAGYDLKEHLKQFITQLGYKVQDFGTSSADPVDYPDFAHAVARAVARGVCDLGIIVDGAGIGSCMVANKVPGVRAAMCLCPQ